MKLLAIDGESVNITEIELEMQANTLYSYFSSILLDELTPLNEHVVYSDANALSEKKKPYFLGEQLILGNALVAGRFDFEDSDVSITKETLEGLISREINIFYTTVLDLISVSDINLYRNFEVKRGEDSFGINVEWVLYTFNIADTRTQEYFIAQLRSTIEKKENIQMFMQKMASLAVNAGG